MTIVDPADFEEALAHAERLAAKTDSLEAALASVVSNIERLFGSAGAGLMIMNDDGALRYVASSNQEARYFEQLQEKLSQGPCVDSLLQNEIVTTENVRTDSRWPELAERLGEVDARAVMGAPVHLSGAPIGSVNVYFAAGREWASSDFDGMDRFSGMIADLIGASLLAHRRDRTITELETALRTRVVIERAIGLVMGREQLTAIEAFNRLRSAARSQRRRVLDVAHDLLDDKRPLPPNTPPERRPE